MAPMTCSGDVLIAARVGGQRPPLQQDGIVDRGGVLVKVINRQELIIERPLIEGLIKAAGGADAPASVAAGLTRRGLEGGRAVCEASY
jgi:hypothetical protein